MFFRKEYVEKILRGEKTQTRRLKPYVYVGKIYSIGNDVKIRILDAYIQRLGDITPSEIQKEGFRSLEEFKAAWIEIYGLWNPRQIVWVYEFRLLNPKPHTPVRRAHPPGLRIGDAKRSTMKGGMKECLNQDTQL